MVRRKGNSVETERVHSFRDIFYCKDKPAKTIYISGGAGIGKTTVARKLISEWCHAHSTTLDISHSMLSDDTRQETDVLFSVTSQENSTDYFESISDKTPIMKQKRSGSFDETDYISYSDDESFDSTYSSDGNVGTTFSDNDKSTVMKQFELLLFVSLRDTYKERSVEEMAQNQLLKTKKMRDLFLNLVENEPESILYILDGLDEWTPPTPLPRHPNVTLGLPLSSCEGNFTILFTSRPWKIETLRPKMGEYDFDISILGIEESASKRLIWLIFGEIISDKDEIDTSAVLFLQEIEKLNIECLSSVPLLLKLLICLWEKGHELPDSQTGIYSSIISKLCSLAMKRNADSDKYQHWISQLERKNYKFPHALDKHPSLLKIFPLIYALGKLSFENISSKSGSLVFKDKDLMEHGISKAEYELSLMIGLLSQKKVIGSLKMSPVRCVSFIHKTFQEYFAALFISIVFEQNSTATDNVQENLLKQITTVVEKVGNYFSSSETAIDVLQVLTFVKEMCPSVIDNITEKIDINEKDVMIATDRNKLTLQSDLNANTKLVTEFLMTHHIHSILVKSSDFRKHDLQLQTEMRYLKILELHTVKMTSSALKRILESLPETSSGISLKLCHVVVRSPRSDADNVNVSITLKNLRSIEIKFMNMCGIEVRFSEHMNTMKRMDCYEVNMNEKELDQLFDTIPDTDQGIVFKFSEVRLKNVVNEDFNLLIKRMKRSEHFQECAFETKYLRGFTCLWSGKELVCKIISFSNVAKPMVDLLSLLEHDKLADDFTTVVHIETDEYCNEMAFNNCDLSLVVIRLNIGPCITSVNLKDIKCTDIVVRELLQHEKIYKLRSLELYNTIVTQTSSHKQQLALTCENLKIEGGNIFESISIRFSRALSSISVSGVTMPNKCFPELLSSLNRERCKLILQNVSTTSIPCSTRIPSNTKTNVEETLCSKCTAKYQRDSAAIENNLTEALISININNETGSITVDSILCEDRQHVGLEIVDLPSMQDSKNVDLTRISSTKKCLCSLYHYISYSSVSVRPEHSAEPSVYHYISSVSVRPKNSAVLSLYHYISSVSVGPELSAEPSFEPIEGNFYIIKEIRLEDLRLTTLDFCALIEGRYNHGLAIMYFENITLIDTHYDRYHAEVDCKCRRQLTIKRTNLLDLLLRLVSRPETVSNSIGEILLEDVTLTENAFCEIKRSAWKASLLIEVKLGSANTANCKTIKRMRIC